jgi:hypothetical protein
LEFRKRIVSGFPSVYRESNSGADINEWSEEAQLNKRWGWYNAIYRVAKGDVTKFDEVTSINVYTALTFLSYEIERDEAEYNRQKRLMSKK